MNLNKTHKMVPNITVPIGSTRELSPLEILSTDSTDYLLGGSLIMVNGRVDKLLFEGGFARAFQTSPTTDRFVFYYLNQDHLGNNREAVNIRGVVHQVTSYYPFGAPYADPAAVMDADLQPYKYNGKELDEETGLYYYGARYYDPKLSVWYSTDPMQMDYPWVSTYGYCINNPILLIDENGNKPIKSRIKYRGKGVFSINVDNLNFISRNTFNRMNNDPQYWRSGEIGISTDIFLIKFRYQTYTADPNYSPAGIDVSNTQINVSNPIAKRSGLPDRRYKNRSVSTITPDAKTLTFAYSSLALNVMVEIFDKYIQYSFFNDYSAIESQTKSLQKAFIAVNKYAYTGKLPSKYLSDVDKFGNLVNYVFQGINPNNDTEIKQIGNMILKENGRYDKQAKKYKTYIEE